MKTGNTYFAALLIVSLAGCSASKKAYNKAKEYEQAGLYVEAAQQDIKALQEKPDFKEAQAHLKKVARQAYEEMLGLCESAEKSENWDQAVNEYSRLDKLLANMRSFGVALETINVSARLRQVREKAAAYHYANAQSFFENQDWRRAGLAYLKAHQYIPNYNQSLEKAIDSNIRYGDQLLEEEQFPKAIAAYGRILEVAPGNPQARQRLAEAHYVFGHHKFEQGLFREAMDEFDRSEQLMPGYKDAAAWAERAYSEAVQYVGVFPFVNETRTPVDVFFITYEVLSRVRDAELPYADFLPEPEVVALLEAHDLLNRQWISESGLLKAAEAEGLDSFVCGKIEEVSIKDRPPRFEEHQHDIVVMVKDSTGKDIETKEPIYYREYSMSRHVEVRAEYVIIETPTGKYLDKQRINVDIDDHARWIAYQGSIYDLPENKRKLLDAPRDPAPPAVLVDKLLARLAERISKDLIRFYR